MRENERRRKKNESSTLIIRMREELPGVPFFAAFDRSFSSLFPSSTFATTAFFHMFSDIPGVCRVAQQSSSPLGEVARNTAHTPCTENRTEQRTHTGRRDSKRTGKGRREADQDMREERRPGIAATRRAGRRLLLLLPANEERFIFVHNRLSGYQRESKRREREHPEERTRDNTEARKRRDFEDVHITAEAVVVEQAMAVRWCI